MASPPQKTALLQAVIARLEAELALQTGAALTSRDEATNDQNRAEGMYDMRSQSAAYLAAGQARLATELAAAIGAYRQVPLEPAAEDTPIAVGSLVTLLGAEGSNHYFIGPVRGGIEVEVDGAPVTVITAASPVGRALVGRRRGETLISPAGRGTQLVRIAEVG